MQTLLMTIFNHQKINQKYFLLLIVLVMDNTILATIKTIPKIYKYLIFLTKMFEILISFKLWKFIIMMARHY